jgi:transcriptional regulator with GAF, ATPase, and Fis domain
VEQVAAGPSTVLLLGETGTGKELVASAIHEASSRKGRPMIKVNCAAIPAALMESEFFGREKGAYAGSMSKQIGRFELAHGSTIFLDEVGDIPPELQVKLLRVLQERQIERLGSPRSIAVDVRIIAATNRNLQEDVRAGRFREDLFYRLNVFPITIPPLRERAEDIPLLVSAFVREFAVAQGKQIAGVTRSSLDALLGYPWPGNVRELRNVVERAVIVATGPRVSLELPASNHPPASRAMTLEDVEREHILHVLRLRGWRIRGANGAAVVLGLNPSTLESRMKKLGISRVSV